MMELVSYWLFITLFTLIYTVPVIISAWAGLYLWWNGMIYSSNISNKDKLLLGQNTESFDEGMGDWNICGPFALVSAILWGITWFFLWLEAGGEVDISQCAEEAVFCRAWIEGNGFISALIELAHVVSSGLGWFFQWPITIALILLALNFAIKSVLRFADKAITVIDKLGDTNGTQS